MSNQAIGKDLALAIQKHRNLRWIYKKRVDFHLPPLLFMTFCFWNQYENDLIVWPFGLCTMALGFVIRIWATRHTGRRIPRGYKHGRTLHLVVTGPYSLVRNPLYIGNIVAMMGLCILSKLLWFVPIVFAYFFLLYSLAVRYEEYKLLVLFGKEYEVYRQKVSRWIPRFSMIREAKGGDFNWYRSLGGELRSAGSASVMILILLGKEILFK